MIFPRKKLILPCHKNGYLQSASDARKYRDRFKRNPLAKVADMFIPKPLRMSPGYPCCCGEEVEPGEPCIKCNSGTTPAQVIATLSGFSGTKCPCSGINGDFILEQEASICLSRFCPENCCYGYYDDSFCYGGALYIAFCYSHDEYTSELYLEVLVQPENYLRCNQMDLVFYKTVSYPIDCEISENLPNKQEVVEGDCCSHGSASVSISI